MLLYKTTLSALERIPAHKLSIDTLNRRWKALQNPVESESDKPSPHVPAGPKKDYSLKEGQTFSISIPGRAKNNTPSNAASDLLGSGSSSGGGGGLGVPLLPPPPPGAPRRR